MPFEARHAIPRRIHRPPLLLFFAMLLLSLATQLATAQDSRSPLLASLEGKYGKAARLQCHFLHRYFENGSLVRVESGVAYFRKPGRMRWEYEKPEKNLFLVDGKNAWFYTPIDHTVTRVPARQSDDWRTPLSFLTGDGKLSRVCARVVGANLPALPDANLPASSAAGFECILKNASKNPGIDPPSGAPTRVFLEISPTGELSRAIVQSPGSVLTEFRFKDWEVDPSLPEALFRFVPPPGVVIVDGLLPSSSSARP